MHNSLVVELERLKRPELPYGLRQRATQVLTAQRHFDHPEDAAAVISTAPAAAAKPAREQL